mmetsp:Transcript_150499/g.464391  ORF Transcript_150499/g.464391 Transcript_150499/m.464391 type:complete len:116 (-) Transcript_150499:221-568(-)
MGADLVFFGWLVCRLASTGMAAWWWVRRLLCILTVVLGCLLLLLDPLRHVLLDHDGVFFKPQRLAMYADAAHHLTPIGKACQVCTILGMVLLIGGVIWSAGVLAALHGWACSGRS